MALDNAEQLCNSKASLTLLINKTNLPFITSDQPIIRLKTGYMNPDNEISGDVFYYPISPYIAITINEQVRSNSTLTDEHHINECNLAILDYSYQNVISNRKDVLERYVSEIEQNST